jgi:hypothetical protein
MPYSVVFSASAPDRQMVVVPTTTSKVTSMTAAVSFTGAPDTSALVALQSLLCADRFTKRKA